MVNSFMMSAVANENHLMEEKQSQSPSENKKYDVLSKRSLTETKLQPLTPEQIGPAITSLKFTPPRSPKTQSVAADEKIASEIEQQKVEKKPVISVDGLRFRNHLFEIVEELKIRRVLDIENEDRLKQILREKHVLDTNVEDLKTKVSCLEEEREEKVTSAKAAFRAHRRQIEDEKAKIAASYESAEKELKMLKDEVRSLQMTKYTLEKRVHEQEKTLVSQRTARDSNLSQIADLQELCKQLNQRTSHLNDVQEKLRKNVGEVSRVNRQLITANQTQTTTLSEQKREIVKLQQQLKEAKVQLKCQPNDSVSANHLHQLQIQDLKQQLAEQSEANMMMKREITKGRQENKASTRRMETFQQLVSRHADILDVKQEELKRAEGSLSQLSTQHKHLQSEYDSTRHKMQMDAEAHQQTMQAWKDEVESHRPCCDQACQMSVEQTEMETQVEVDSSNHGCQTLAPQLQNSETQTVSVACCHQWSQTEDAQEPELEQKEADVDAVLMPAAKKMKIDDDQVTTDDGTHPEKKPRYSFQFLSFPPLSDAEKETPPSDEVQLIREPSTGDVAHTLEPSAGEVQPISDAAENVAASRGILQAPSVLSNQRCKQKKVVTFAEDLEEMEIIMESDSSPENNNVEKSEEVVCGGVKTSSIIQEDKSLFSDDEDTADITSQVNRIQRFLQKDRLKLSEN